MDERMLLIEIKLGRLLFFSFFFLTRHKIEYRWKWRGKQARVSRVTKLPYQMWAAGEPSCTWSLLKESVRRQTQRKLCGSLYFRPTLCHIGRAGVKNIKILNY